MPSDKNPLTKESKLYMGQNTNEMFEITIMCSTWIAFEMYAI